MSSPRRPVISIRLVVAAVTVVLIAAAVVSVGAVSERNSRRALTREIETRLALEARNLALTGAGALLSEFPELILTPLIRKMQAERPELAIVVVLDHQGLIRGHADPRLLGERFEPPAGLAGVEGDTPLLVEERLVRTRDLLVMETPVSHPSEPHLGQVVVALRSAYIENAVSAARRSLVMFLALLLAVGVVLGLVVVSWLLRPIAALRAGLERIGRGDLTTPLAIRDRTELGLLAEAVNDMAGRLVVARAETVERERLAHELDLARAIQQRLLPRGRRTVAGHVLVGAHRPAAEVGGDYYDFLELPDGRTAVAIADVSGKGMGGCLITSMLAALLRALHTSHTSPSALLVQLERHLTTTLEPGEFVTMFYGLLEPERGRMVYASAGHTPLLTWRAFSGKVEWHPTRGIPLGAVRGGALVQTLEDRVIQLAPGDLLLQFTDGISEAFDSRGEEMFGFERVDALVRQHAPQGPDRLVEALTAAVAEWTGGEPQDDETLLVVTREVAATSAATAPVAGRGLPDPPALLAEAEARGVPLRLRASFEALNAIAPWLSHCPDLAELDGEGRRRLELALYEACANVVEHGLQFDAEREFDLWWVPGLADPRASTPGTRVRSGYFLLRDHGYPFSPGRWQPRDPADPARHRTGRGFGLDLIHLVMEDVVYRPAAPAGNITLMTFDPARARQEGKEDVHV